jgi:hypothetical protein
MSVLSISSENGDILFKVISLQLQFRLLMMQTSQRNTIHGLAFSDDSCSLYILTSPAQEIPLIDSMANAHDSDGKSHRPE